MHRGLLLHRHGKYTTDEENMPRRVLLPNRIVLTDWLCRWPLQRAYGLVVKQRLLRYGKGGRGRGPLKAPSLPLEAETSVLRPAEKCAKFLTSR